MMKGSSNKQSYSNSRKKLNKIILFIRDKDIMICMFLITSFLLIFGLHFIEQQLECLIIPMMIVVLLFSYTLFLSKKDSSYKS